jgi:Flp pilus assembly secretin CpaC
MPSAVPWLGDIPVLGVLFRSKDYQAGQSELLVFVTPEVVKNIDSDTENAATTPNMKKWHGKDADAELLQEPKPQPKWMKPLEVDELTVPEKKEEKAPAGESEDAAPAEEMPEAAPAQPGTNYEPARPSQP